MDAFTNKIFIFDFDSTLIQVETFAILAQIALAHHPEKEARLQTIHEITNLAMEGKYSYQESLRERLQLLSLKQSFIDQTTEILKKLLSPSIVRNRDFFQHYANQIYIVSGSFIEIVWPIVQSLGIKREHVFANRFLYNFEGTIVGYDEHYPLAQDQGKVKLLSQLKLKGDIVVIGDGINDYEIKAAELAHTFIAFTENIARPAVVKVADSVINELEGLFITCDLPYLPPPFSTKKVLLLENIHPAVGHFFKSQGYEVRHHDHSLTSAELQQQLADVHVLGIRSKTELSAQLLDTCPHLETIGAFCIGTNQIDLPHCSARGIAVFNAPFSNSRSVVELAIANIILLTRQAAKAHNALLRGHWQKSSTNAHEVRGKVLGIIGYGNIGSQLSILAEALGMQVLFYDLEDKLSLGNAKACHTLEELLLHADIISVHVDGRAANRHLIGEKQFALMKNGVIFLNLSRDLVVDYNALTQALTSHKLGGAAVDVFPNEPLQNTDQFSSPLQQAENVILTPHIGGSTEEAQQNIGEYVSKNLHAYLNNGATLGSVNFPQLNLPTLNCPQRIIHIHQNVPGILAQINSLFATLAINIEGQFLKTNENIGYVITDINQMLTMEQLNALQTILGTIKIRCLNYKAK